MITSPVALGDEGDRAAGMHRLGPC
jgi:hypothetical protein